jgi:hypothetical protein
MKKKMKKWQVFLVLILIALGAWYGSRFVPRTKIDPISSNRLATHINDTYGFSISYPKTCVPQTKFLKYDLLSDQWMAGATDNSKGKPILCIPIIRMVNESSYPRAWNTEVRIGVTEDYTELTSFLFTSEYSTDPPKQEKIGNVMFYVFPIQDTAMMKFVRGYSYRTIHNGVGYAVELLTIGSNYREDKSPKDLSDQVLNEYDKQAEKVVKSFLFLD